MILIKKIILNDNSYINNNFDIIDERIKNVNLNKYKNEKKILTNANDSSSECLKSVNLC